MTTQHSSVSPFFCFVGCTIMGQQGNGEERGTCKEDQLCQSDGTCKPLCTVKGSQGNGTHRGTCEEGELCFSNGICRVDSE